MPLIGLMPAMSTTAGSWDQALTLPMTVEYDSNPTFAPRNPEGVARLRVSPVYGLSWRDGRHDVLATFGMSLERSTDSDTSVPRDDPRLGLNWVRSTPTGEYGVAARYEERSTRAAEIDDAAFVVADATQETRALSGHWDEALSPLLRVRLTGDYRRSRYDNTQLQDYDEFGAAAHFTRLFSERTQFFAQMGAVHYEPLAGWQSTSQYYSATLGAGWQASPQLTLQLNSGGRTWLATTIV
ncbi:hypothetical protein [Alkalilimnicola ehrlichii]|uniref:hypothetical protein n=1 Tax=Alkalilimnicola ehrlichii TaxID=351052 RepID=UPI0011C02E02|nr:hypothetical protein [Alkalilimnicola ehrlichii]